jgi:predicted O-methyltransferase YrrM
MLWRGLVAESGPGKPKTEMFRRLNRFIRDDRRVTPVTLPIGDGMTLARKR